MRTLQIEEKTARRLYKSASQEFKATLRITTTRVRMRVTALAFALKAMNWQRTRANNLQNYIKVSLNNN